MATQSPIFLLEGLLRDMAKRLPAPPPWLVDEAQRRIVLLLNHVLMQETAATERLARQQGRVIAVFWQAFSLRLLVTPAGLLDIAAADLAPALSLWVDEESAGRIAQSLWRGDKPAVRIEGDVQLAAEVNWLVDHVRWDLEEDLARVIGDAPANVAVKLARQVALALRSFAPPPSAHAAAGHSP